MPLFYTVLSSIVSVIPILLASVLVYNWLAPPLLLFAGRGFGSISVLIARLRKLLAFGSVLANRAL
jgi:hypothetical protein